MRLAFMGSPDFSVSALEALVAAEHEIACVYSQPPRPAGRGQAERLCAVHARAVERKLPVRTPHSMRDAAEIEAFAALNVDACVVVAFGQILPVAVLEAPTLGCLNIHASLLPRWRGAAPIQRSIEAGDAETGVTIMQMAEGLDTGPMLMTQATPIEATDTAGTLHDRLSIMGADMIGPALVGCSDGSLIAVPQDATVATYAAKINKAESRLDFTQTAKTLERKVRAFAPSPGAWFERTDDAGKSQRVKVLLAEAIADGSVGSGAMGTVIDDRLTIQTPQGAFRPVLVQPGGKGVMETAAYLRGKPIKPGTVLLSTV